MPVVQSLTDPVVPFHFPCEQRVAHTDIAITMVQIAVALLRDEKLMKIEAKGGMRKIRGLCVR